jgi:hypothetical protein
VCSLLFSIYSLFLKNNSNCKKKNQCLNLEKDNNLLKTQLHTCSLTENSLNEEIKTCSTSEASLQSRYKKCCNSPPSPPGPSSSELTKWVGKTPTTKPIKLPTSYNIIIMSPNDSMDKINKRVPPLQTRLSPSEGDYPNPKIIPLTILFNPGKYDGDINLGYYVSLIGLGSSPEEVILTGTINIYRGESNSSQCNDGYLCSSDNIFWRTIENLTITSNQTWNVSQGNPFRKINIKNTANINLGHTGSPGFMSYIYSSSSDNGTINMPSGKNTSGDVNGLQQYCFKSLNINNLTDNRLASFNTVYINPFGNLKNNEGETVVSKDRNSCNSCGVSQSFKTKDISWGLPVFISDEMLGYYYEKPVFTNYGILGVDNNLLDFESNIKYCNSKNLNELNLIEANTTYVILPGIYTVNKTIDIKQDNVKIIGLGLPIIKSNISSNTISINGKNCLVASLIINASPLNFKQKNILYINGSQTRIFDIFFRSQRLLDNMYKNGVGVNCMVHIDTGGQYTYLEDLWLWRGDKCPVKTATSTYSKWPCQNFQLKNINPIGLQVDADNVKAVGLMVEHQKNPIIWNGEHGKIYFLQGEGSYTSKMNAYFTIGKNVKNLTLTGGNIYSQFGNKYGGDPGIPGLEIIGTNIDNININDTTFGSWATLGTGGFTNGVIKWGNDFYGKNLFPFNFDNAAGKGAKLTICNLKSFLTGKKPINLKKPSDILNKAFPAGVSTGQGSRKSITPCDSSHLCQTVKDGNCASFSTISQSHY